MPILEGGDLDMKNLLGLVLIALVIVTLPLAGCKKKSTAEHPSTSAEHPTTAQPKAEHPAAEHPQ